MRVPIAVLFLAFLMTWGTSVAEPEKNHIPEKAVCRTCEIRGAMHGAEDVVAWREHDGAHYYFCSEDCGKAFDAFPAAYVPQPLPRPAPDATVTTLEGTTLTLAELEGQAVLVDFWATWCAPCIKAMPELNELHTKWADANFTVLGISIDEKPDKVVPKLVKKKKLRYPIALDTASTPAWNEFHVAAIPAMFLIDEKRRIIAEWRGTVDFDDVRRAVDALLAKRATED